MKLLLPFLLSALFSANAQALTEPKKFIQVTGSAEMSIKPDEIELQVTLSEYDEKGKKMRLDQIDSEFNKVLKSNNIDPKSISYGGTDSWYWWYWWNYRNRYLQTKTITLKLGKETNFLKLVEDLNKKWTQSIQISKTTSNEIQRLRKEVKIEAMKAAKAKAAYLLESVNEKIGSLLEAEEMPEQTDYYWLGRQNVASNSNLSNTYASSPSGQDSGIENVSDIKLRYEIRAKFEIK
ncbi:MAG TPA: SIMPL domain-containing protein [Flavobacterium sp.]|nr:SIMPL domain-containing protein [Flavobacterium sp.]